MDDSVKITAKSNCVLNDSHLHERGATDFTRNIPLPLVACRELADLHKQLFGKVCAVENLSDRRSIELILQHERLVSDISAIQVDSILEFKFKTEILNSLLLYEFPFERLESCFQSFIADFDTVVKTFCRSSLFGKNFSHAQTIAHNSASLNQSSILSAGAEFLTALEGFYELCYRSGRPETDLLDSSGLILKSYWSKLDDLIGVLALTACIILPELIAKRNVFDLCLISGVSFNNMHYFAQSFLQDCDGWVSIPERTMSLGN